MKRIILKMNKKKLLLFVTVLLAILAGLGYYIFLPALNIGSIELWLFIVLAFLLFGGVHTLLG